MPSFSQDIAKEGFLSLQVPLINDDLVKPAFSPLTFLDNLIEILFIYYILYPFSTLLLILVWLLYASVVSSFYL